jgi:histidinol-phosphate aminotransferase
MDTMSVKIPNYISSLVPYRAGKPIAELAREKNLTKIVKLASNENPLGPSPKAQEAVVRSLHDGHRYPDPSGYELLQVVAKKFGKQPSQIVAGAGTDALLAYIIVPVGLFGLAMKMILVFGVIAFSSAAKSKP